MKLLTQLALPLFLLVSGVSADIEGFDIGGLLGGGGGGMGMGGKGMSKSRRNRRRTLLASNSMSLKPNDPHYQETISRCGKYEYDASLYVDTHVFGVASPKEDALAASCPFIATHSMLSKDPAVGVSKEILIWDTKDKAKYFKEEGFYPVATLKFSDIARAIDEAQPTKSNVPLFDVWHNNCADYIINLGSALGLKADSKVTSFVVGRLMGSYSNEWVEKVRNKMNYFSIFEGRHLGEQDMTDEGVIELLVETRTSELY